MSAETRPHPIFTDEKIHRLTRVYVSIVVNACLIIWQESIILKPLKNNALDMQHMDPSEIVSIPFSLSRVTTFVMVPVVIQMMYWLIKTPTRITMNILSLIKVTGIIYALMALSGNYIVTNWQHSLLSALYIATLISTTSNELVTSNILDEFPFKDISDPLAFSRLYCTIMFTVAFQVLTVLDHGMQIQRWPIPVIMGGTYGFAFGSLAGIVLNYLRSQNEPPKGKD